MTTVMTQPHSQPLFPDWKASYNPSLRWDEGKKWAGLYHNIAKYMDISAQGSPAIVIDYPLVLGSRARRAQGLIEMYFI